MRIIVLDSMKKHLHVAVGVIQNSRGQILIAKRAASAHQGGLWEFPGGKVDAGETLQQALKRELKEELAIEVCASEPLIQIRHDYPDKSVFLDVHKVTDFSGEPKGNEGQPVKWIDPSDLKSFEFPAANRPIIHAINLPNQFAITGSFDSKVDFEKKFTRLIDSGVKLIQLRLSDFSLHKHQEYLDFAMDYSGQHSVQLQINCSLEEFQSIALKPFAGLHVNSQQLKRLTTRPVSDTVLLGASCHSLEELAQAAKIQVDYVCLSPVKVTRSHPDALPLGWEEFSNLVEKINCPVYALGGMRSADLSKAISCGAQGIASISEWWD